MTIKVSYQKIQDAADYIRSRAKTAGLTAHPEVGVILGSGLGSVAEQVTDKVLIPYTDVPHFHGTTVEGHVGRVVMGKFKGIPVIFLQGRFHYYEGYSMEEVALPTRVLCNLGVKALILTNAAGGVNTNFEAGDLMLIADHLNLMGDNPLKGPNLAQLGPRFPDMTEAYCKEFLALMEKSATELGITVRKGVYAGLLGPTYETPSEIRMYRTLGADAVGMSTVPETIVANHIGVRVAGISYISNMGAGMSPQKLTHEEVLDNSKAGADKLVRLLELSIPRIARAAAEKVKQ